MQACVPEAMVCLPSSFRCFFFQELYRADKEQRRLARKAKLDAFFAMLKTCGFDENAKWEDIRLTSPLSESPAFLALDESDRVTAFKVRCGVDRT
jgi:hypothetical protein